MCIRQASASTSGLCLVYIREGLISHLLIVTVFLQNASVAEKLDVLSAVYGRNVELFTEVKIAVQNFGKFGGTCTVSVIMYHTNSHNTHWIPVFPMLSPQLRKVGMFYGNPPLREPYILNIVCLLVFRKVVRFQVSSMIAIQTTWNQTRAQQIC